MEALLSLLFGFLGLGWGDKTCGGGDELLDPLGVVKPLVGDAEIRLRARIRFAVDGGGDPRVFPARDLQTQRVVCDEARYLAVKVERILAEHLLDADGQRVKGVEHAPDAVI